MKPILKSNFPIFSLGGVVILFLSYFLCVNVNAEDFTNIGSGSPGLRIITKPGNSNAIFIYRGLPEMPFGDYIGFNVATNYTIQAIIEHGYDFQEVKAERLSLTGGGVSLKLYPFGPNSAFTDEGGEKWGSYTDQWATICSQDSGYTFDNGNLTIFTNVQQAARTKYRLRSDEIFLGFLDNRVFFCKNGSRPSEVFWREEGSQKEYYYRMPKSVPDVFGVMKALHPDKDVGFVVLRKVPMFSNIFHPPYEQAFIEVSLSSGKLVRSDE